MKHIKKVITLLLAAMMVLAMSSVAFAADHTVSTTSDTHTYQIYQVFTGTVSGDQLVNLKYGTNAKTGTPGNSVSASDMAALATIEGKTYANDQEKIADLSAFVNLTNPVAEIGKGKDSSAELPEGYYVIKDTDNSLTDPETYTLYLFKVLDDDLEIVPKDGTTTVDKDVTETDDTAGTTTAEQKGADYDEGDSIPYTITIDLAKNVSDYKHYVVTLTDTLSEGLTPPAQSAVTAKIYKKDGTTEITTLGSPTVTVEGQVITVKYEAGTAASTTALGDTYKDLNEGKIVVTYNAVLNDKAKAGVEGNPNTYTITYSNNPNGDDTGTTPEKDVNVYTYELTIEKVDGNNQPLQGAGFTLYKKVTAAYEGAQTGADIKAGLATGVKADKLADASYYVPVTMTEAVDATTGKVTHSTDKKIDAGDYVLIETTIPTGYNAYAGMEITLSSTINEAGELTGLTATPSTLTVASDLSGAAGTVTNESGTELPSTGGIGTVIFYVLGSLLVVGCGIVLISKRRINANK